MYMAPAGANEALNTRISPAIEDYLKAIYTLQLSHTQVTTSLLAEQLGFKPASVTGMLKTLAELHLVELHPLPWRRAHQRRRRYRARGCAPPPPDRALPGRGAGL